MTDYDERANNVEREYHQEKAIEEAFNKGLLRAIEIGKLYAQTPALKQVLEAIREEAEKCDYS